MAGRGSWYGVAPARVWASLVAAVVLAGVLTAAGPAEAASAQQAGAVLPPQAQAECRGNVPIVVGSDAAAQSDIYSAVALAGVIGTDCVILAGPRGQPMAAAQWTRLDAAAVGGFIVGGTAAVPAAKTAGRDMVRIAGNDRWHTARLVGEQARRSAGGTPGDTAASAGAQNPDTDCTADVPIVAASDPAAESDRYSAVTLAGAIGTDCVILAGARDQPMAADQQARLAAAARGGFVIGGTASVPQAKTAGRTMTRLAGTDRWHTARLVGEQARRVAAGSTAAATRYTDVPTSHPHAHSIDVLRRDGVLTGTDCAHRRFCPDQPVTGQTFATWLTRVLDGHSPAGPIARLIELGIATDCSDHQTGLCASGTVLREQMAAFFVRAFDLAAPIYPIRLVDVDSGSVSDRNISRLTTTTIDPGCGFPSRFCPNEAVSRAQMANLLAGAIDWQEARDEVAVTGSDDSIKLTVTYDEDDYEATVRWRKPSSKKGRVDHYVLQSRLILENFGPKSYQIIESKSSKTKYRVDLSNGTNTNRLYAFRVIVVYADGKRLATSEVKTPSEPHQLRDAIFDLVVEPNQKEHPWLLPTWIHMNSNTGVGLSGASRLRVE